MYNKIITLGILISFFAPALVLARIPVRITPRFALKVFVSYTVAYLFLGLAIKFVPNLVNPW
ncbi:hypothetical protein [Pseudobacteriovorax antillogorgiicola]|uniref:Uncharacterized protein n=2 Tax=Pseudobacteriovorax antillogorgiicola TaxID=1513793 RepID=A0A1Y6BLW0_9BACT|nr:hypothetical protein [Pseudobacteriovorax antillogorgiicola]TCS54553.1 hypothetical protein EDD56_10666 [Pseudobacteriovorax antillogorgiicola]SMF18443.1 hypothetical protein SAMN06296036_106177 [Pseudobacteriovorax antillogorgiicola]